MMKNETQVPEISFCQFVKKTIGVRLERSENVGSSVLVLCPGARRFTSHVQGALLIGESIATRYGTREHKIYKTV